MARKYDVAAVRALPVSPVPPGGLGGHGRRPAGDTGPPPAPLSRVPADGCDCPLRITPPPGHRAFIGKIERLLKRQAIDRQPIPRISRISSGLIRWR